MLRAKGSSPVSTILVTGGLLRTKDIGCKLARVVWVIGEGGPRRGGLRIHPRILPWTCFRRAMGTKDIEHCVSVIRKRETWDAGLHYTSAQREALGFSSLVRCKIRIDI